MTVRRLLATLALVLVCADAPAESAATETLVLVSPPDELDEAVRASLAPWRVKIIVIEMASGTPAELALSLGAGYVVWRDDDELVLWDASAGNGERRDVPMPLDDASAAALALSIKTWMHLGAPPAGAPAAFDAVGDTIAEPAPQPARRGAPAPAPRLRVEAATGARTNLGDDGRTDLRLAVGAGARTGPVDVSLGVELGPSHPSGDGMFSGDLSTVSAGVFARWGLTVAPSITVAPRLGLTLQRSAFTGTDAVDRELSATATSPGLDGAGVIEWRRGWLLVSAEVGATVIIRAQELQDRNVRLITPAHIEPAGLVRVGLVLR